ncbi:MAG TPA: helix-turn-helix domain-containing protein [Conexibacter sp.]|nr:helix-turn-helix domain-containing protein [Conexibacter sp.]
MADSDLLRPWHELPPAVATVLRPELKGVARETIAAIRVEVPAYARPLEGPFGRGLVAGVEEAMRQFLDGIETGGRVPRSRVYVDLGRGEVRAGRSLDVLLNAYRVGARVAWRRFSAVGVSAGLPPETLYRLAESIFAYIDELSAKSAEGYALEQSAAAGERRAHRQRLARLLVRDPPADPLDVEAAARSAEWRLPAQLAALAIPAADGPRIVPRLSEDTISEVLGDVVCAFVPDPGGAGRRAQLERAVGARHHAALGPVVPWSDAAISLARARAMLDLAAEGTIPAEGLLDAGEHLAALLLRSDRRLSQELIRTRLAPLDALPAGSRARLTATLVAWLAAQGRLQAVAEDLHVHPQTVRYRLAKLRELLGEALDDPQGRFELELALRAEGASGAERD